MKKKEILFLIFIICAKFLVAQKLPFRAELEVQTSITSDKAVPFWMRSNQYGNIPPRGVSASLLSRLYKDYDSTKTSRFNWGGGFEGRMNAGKTSQFVLIEAYAKAKISVFQLKAGRSKDVMGINGDTLLSSGNFAISGNALGIPKVEISIPDYLTIPIWGGIFSFKGTFSHGWIGRMPVQDTIANLAPPAESIIAKENRPMTYLHQKSLYGKFGKSDWKLKVIGGFSHQVMWGNEQKVYGEGFGLSPLKTFYYVAFGKAYGGKQTGVPLSKIGNQLGSIDLGVEYDFNRIKLFVYRQNFYDVGALSKLANIRDGLNGVSIQNKNYDQKNDFNWEKLIVEFFYSRNQAGELWSKHTASGDENYYNNFYYKQGWSYKGIGLGTPLITEREMARTGFASSPKEYFINNRVVAAHLGIKCNFFQWRHIIKCTYSENYGTFNTSPIGSSTGSTRHPPVYGLFQKSNQFSAAIEGNKTLKNNVTFGYAMYADRGDLLYNSLGILLKVNKKL